MSTKTLVFASATAPSLCAIVGGVAQADITATRNIAFSANGENPWGGGGELGIGPGVTSRVIPTAQEVNAGGDALFRPLNDAAPVPEPTSPFLVLIAAVVGMSVRRRKRLVTLRIDRIDIARRAGRISCVCRHAPGAPETYLSTGFDTLRPFPPEENRHAMTEKTRWCELSQTGFNSLIQHPDGVPNDHRV
jgi:hypothetical protein